MIEHSVVSSLWKVQNITCVSCHEIQESVQLRANSRLLFKYDLKASMPVFWRGPPCFSGRTPGPGPEAPPYGDTRAGGGRYLPHTSSSSGLAGGGARRRSTDAAATSAHNTLSRRGSRHRGAAESVPPPPPPRSPSRHPFSKPELGLSEPGKTPTQDASDR